MPEYYVGLMSGTSMDGIDAALVDFSDNVPKLITTHDHPWPESLTTRLLALRPLDDDQIRKQHDLDDDIARQFALATTSLLKKSRVAASQVIAIGSHGQTVRHRPDASQPFSLQLGNAEILAHETSIDVIADFRTADIMAGGQGAPLAPAFHQDVFHTDHEDRCIVNIGGIANITLLHANTTLATTGFDTGPGNTLMDAWIQHCQQQPYDKDGSFAQSGHINKTLLDELLREAYLTLSPPKSTGFELFNLAWLQKHDIEKISPADVMATLCEYSAITIADAIQQFASSCQRVLVCGGGVHNPVLMRSIARSLPDCLVESTIELGFDPDWIEAMAFAWLARCHLHSKTGNLPCVTGAKEAVVLGKLTRHHKN